MKKVIEFHISNFTKKRQNRIGHVIFEDNDTKEKMRIDFNESMLQDLGRQVKHLEYLEKRVEFIPLESLKARKGYDPVLNLSRDDLMKNDVIAYMASLTALSFPLWFENEIALPAQIRALGKVLVLAPSLTKIEVPVGALKSAQLMVNTLTSVWHQDIKLVGIEPEHVALNDTEEEVEPLMATPPPEQLVAIDKAPQVSEPHIIADPYRHDRHEEEIWDDVTGAVVISCAAVIAYHGIKTARRPDYLNMLGSLSNLIVTVANSAPRVPYITSGAKWMIKNTVLPVVRTASNYLKN